MWPDWAVIREEWLSEWLTLPFAVHRCRSFAQFIDWRLDCGDDNDDDLIYAEPMEDWLQPGPHRWHEVAASAGTLSDLIVGSPAPEPDGLR